MIHLYLELYIIIFAQYVYEKIYKYARDTIVLYNLSGCNKNLKEYMTMS
jgi:hypothetical protein